MASLLRQIVAGPRAKHPEAGLDLCYVTDNIIATSGPGATYPQVAYRNPLKDLVKFLDLKHGDKWAIWEFRAEGTGYPDSEVYNRVWHYPWPDHHPPPFALIPLIMGSMRNWLKEPGADGRVVVVHCKAGKGRSGTISCGYLISEEGWTPEDAMQRFTERRMRPGFGAGLTIPSQRRWISYIDRWMRNGKMYIERPVEIMEVHVWGLRDGVKIVVEGYVDEGKVIKKFHTFQSSEREVVRGAIRAETGFADVAREVMGLQKSLKEKSRAATTDDLEEDGTRFAPSASDGSGPFDSDVIFRPSSRVVLASSDVNIDFERRNKTKYGGFTMVTSVAHVWFNAFFEGSGPENKGFPDKSGVFEMEWDAMDGIKGSSRKGTRAFDKFAVVWKVIEPPGPSVVITEPAEGELVHQAKPADWRGVDTGSHKKLGIREEDAESDSVSRASSVQSQRNGDDASSSAEELAGVKSDIVNESRQTKELSQLSADNSSDLQTTALEPDKIASNNGGSTPSDNPPVLISGLQQASTSDLPDGVKESAMEEPDRNIVGTVKREKNGDP